VSHGRIEPAVRDIADEELRAFREHGWVHLRGLVSKADTAALLAKGKELVARAQTASAGGNGVCEDFWFSWSNSVFEARFMADGPFVDIARSAEMGRVAWRLVNAARSQTDQVPVRSLGGNLFCKMGGGSPWGREIPFHQDGPSFDVCAPGFATIWIALDEVDPDQGAMRFLDRSHCAGALPGHRSGFPLARNPELLANYHVTAPLRYAAGDASAHDGFTLHGSPENRTERSRWGYACLYVASDLTFDDSAYADRPHGFRPPLERYPISYDGRV